MRILFLSRWFPEPPDNGSKMRITNVLKQLAVAHEISLVSFTDAGKTTESPWGDLGEYCARVRTAPFHEYRPTSARALTGLFSIQPRSLVDTYSRDLAAAISDEARRFCPDLVIASQLAMAPYVSILHGVPAILEEIELTVYRDEFRHAPTPRYRVRALLTWLKLQAYLKSILPRFTACTVVSEGERRNLTSAVPGYRSVRVLPNAIDLAAYSGGYGPPEPNSLIYAGSVTYRANYDAVQHFLTNIYPRISRGLAAPVVRITGRHEGVDLSGLPRLPGVQFTGRVDDVRPLVARSWGAVVPLRVGGGSRLKILESMALGTPVISTAKGAEGLEVRAGEDILLADDPAEFAERTDQLLQSITLRQRLAEGGRQLVESKYNWDAVGRDLRSLVETIPVRARIP